VAEQPQRHLRITTGAMPRYCLLPGDPARAERIVHLSLHANPAISMGRNVDVGMWWRRPTHGRRSLARLGRSRLHPVLYAQALDSPEVPSVSRDHGQIMRQSNRSNPYVRLTEWSPRPL
jgi:hypothetical protein